MEFNVKKNVLCDALQKVNSIVSGRSTLQILSNVLLECEKEKLILTTTDLNIRIKTELCCQTIKTGKTTISAKKFQEVIRMLPQEDIKIVSNEDNSILMECGTSKFKLNCLPVTDFPAPVEISTLRRYTINKNDFLKMIKQINYAVTLDDTRKALNGILISLNESNIVTVATDGRRLALVERTVEDYSGNYGDAILPIKSAQELIKLLDKDGKVVVEIGEKMVSFFMNNTTKMTTRLIEENYPNYRQVIPISFSRKILIKRENLTNALLRVKSVVSEKSYFIKLNFKLNNIELSGNSQEIGECTDSIQISYEGPETNISFNPDFLLEPLKEIEADNIHLKMNDGYNPVAITTEEGFLYVIMPMRNR